MTRLLLTIGLIASLETTAAAQAIASFDAQDAVDPISVVEGPGVKVGESTVLRPVLGVESGFVSNVFYEEQGPNSAALIRVLAQVGAGSLGRKRLARPGEVDENPLTAVESGGREETIDNPGTFEYRADLRLTYDFLLSSNDAVSEQGGLGAGALFRGVVYPQSTWSFGFLENFERLIRATNFESERDTNRMRNDLGLRLLFQPRGRSLSAALRYHNQIDYFEDDSNEILNRMQHTFALRGMWQWLPVTRFYVEGRVGIASGLGENAVKVDSYPVTVEAGVQTLLSLNTTLNAHAGYTNGFYAEGPSYSAPTAGVQLGWRYTPLGRIKLMYDYAHVDSINANFYRDHLIRVSLEQGFAPFVFTVRPAVHFRRYEGVNLIVPAMTNVRDDMIFAVNAGAHYNFRSWIAATVDYHFSTVQTDFRYMVDAGVLDDPSFSRHELLVGVRAAL